MAETKIPTAHNLEEAVDTLEGYAAMNSDEQSEIARIAYLMYEERGGEHGHHDEDWHRAEAEYRRRNAAEKTDR